MAVVQILIFGEVVGFKIVQFIATQVKMKFFFHGVMIKFFQPICMKTTDIKLLTNDVFLTTHAVPY